MDTLFFITTINCVLALACLIILIRMAIVSHNDLLDMQERFSDSEEPNYESILIKMCAQKGLGLTIYSDNSQEPKIGRIAVINPVTGLNLVFIEYSGGAADNNRQFKLAVKLLTEKIEK